MADVHSTRDTPGPARDELERLLWVLHTAAQALQPAVADVHQALVELDDRHYRSSAIPVTDGDQNMRFAVGNVTGYVLVHLAGLLDAAAPGRPELRERVRALACDVAMLDVFALPEREARTLPGRVDPTGHQLPPARWRFDRDLPGP